MYDCTREFADWKWMYGCIGRGSHLSTHNTMAALVLFPQQYRQVSHTIIGHLYWEWLTCIDEQIISAHVIKIRSYCTKTCKTKPQTLFVCTLEWVGFAYRLTFLGPVLCRLRSWRKSWNSSQRMYQHESWTYLDLMLELEAGSFICTEW